jgi:hypothetical protein
MKPKRERGATGTWIIRDVPTELMVRFRIAALTDHNKTVKALMMELVEAHLAELEKKGVLPKTRG